MNVGVTDHFGPFSWNWHVSNSLHLLFLNFRGLLLSQVLYLVISSMFVHVCLLVPWDLLGQVSIFGLCIPIFGCKVFGLRTGSIWVHDLRASFALDFLFVQLVPSLQEFLLSHLVGISVVRLGTVLFESFAHLDLNSRSYLWREFFLD